MIGRSQLHIIFASTLLFGCINNVEQNDPKFSAVAVPEHAGSVSPARGSIVPTDSIELFASPNLGYAFTFWNQDPSDTLNPKPFTFEEDTEITANFEFNGYLNTFGGSIGELPSRFIKKGSEIYYVGTTFSQDGQFSGLNDAEQKGYFGKLTSSGEFTILGLYGGSYQDYFLDLIPSNDGNFIINGLARSPEGDFAVKQGNFQDVLIAKVDEFGTLLWSRVLGGTGIDFVNRVIPYKNGYLLSGATYSNDGFLGIDDSYSSLVAYIIKFNEQGDIEWSRVFDGASDEVISHLQATEDGAILATGQTTSKDGVFENDLDLVSTTFTMKISGEGDILWTTHYPTNDISRARGSYLLSDGTMVLAGSERFSDDLNNIWVTKVDVTTGHILWSNTFGGSGDDVAYVVEVHEGDIYVGGAFLSEDDIFTETNDLFRPDAFILKLDKFGELQSVFLLVGNSSDRIFDLHIENDLLYYFGETSSTEFDFSFRNINGVSNPDMFIGVKELKDFED